MEHPVDNLGRKSGFLIPTIGQSNTRGTIFGDGFYWAISRNSDATLGAALYSARGWAQFGDFRAIGYTYGIQAAYYGVIDNRAHRRGRTTSRTRAAKTYRVNAFKNLGDGFHAVLSVDYLSSFIFRQVFALGFSEAIQSEVRSTGFVYKNWNGYCLWCDGRQLPGLPERRCRRLHPDRSLADTRVLDRGAAVQPVQFCLCLRCSRQPAYHAMRLALRPLRSSVA